MSMEPAWIMTKALAAMQQVYVGTCNNGVIMIKLLNALVGSSLPT